MHLDELIDRIDRQMLRPSIDEDVKAWANDQLRGIYDDLERVSRENAYEDHVLDHLRQERVKYQADSVDTHPYEDTRTTPLCLCSGSCPIKRGELPKEIENADSLTDGVRAFKKQHRAPTPVLTDARDEWTALVADVEHELRRILAAFGNNEIPQVSVDESSTVEADA